MKVIHLFEQDLEITWNIHGSQKTSLKGAPKESKTFDCSYCKLPSLKYAPRKVNGNFLCFNNKLTSLEGIPEIVEGNIDAENNNVTSLKGIHKMIKRLNGCLYLDGNPIESHVLGVLLIDGVQAIDISNKDVQDIVNGFLPNTRGMEAVFDCQEELIDMGYDEYAEL